LQADVELGGSDQKFNLLVGRSLQAKFNQRPQSILMMPILEGTDGKNKMSKSLGNYIGLNDSPNNMYGKIMSISDELMFRYYELLSNRSIQEIESYKKQVKENKINPKILKEQLALEIVERFWPGEAQKAQITFNALTHKTIPDSIEQISVKIDTPTIWICHLIKNVGFSDSTSKAKRLIDQKGVYINDTVLEDSSLQVKKGDSFVLKVGKKLIAKITIN